MSGQNTPFIPPLDTGEPVIPPVIPNPQTAQSPRYPPVHPPVPGVPSSGWDARGHQPQMPPYGTPYTPAPFFAVSPYPQGLSSTTFGYSQLPPILPNGLASDYRGYQEQTPFLNMGGTALPANAPGLSPRGSPWHGGGTMPLHHSPPQGMYPPSPWTTGQGAPRGWPGGDGMPYTANWGPFVTPMGYTTALPGWGGGYGGWANPVNHQEPPRRMSREASDRMPKFTAGSHCESIGHSSY